MAESMTVSEAVLDRAMADRRRAIDALGRCVEEEKAKIARAVLDLPVFSIPTGDYVDRAAVLALLKPGR